MLGVAIHIIFNRNRIGFGIADCDVGYAMISLVFVELTIDVVLCYVRGPRQKYPRSGKPPFLLVFIPLSFTATDIVGSLDNSKEDAATTAKVRFRE